VTTELDALFRPRSVAVIGASRSQDNIGGQIFHNMLAADFQGPVYPVNPNATHVQAVAAYPSVTEIAGSVDLAVIAVPRSRVMDAVEECGVKGVRCAVVITAGFGEVGSSGVAAQTALRDRARALGIRIVGPNCLGVLNTDESVRLNANFAHAWPPSGNVSFCSQSGALGLAVLDFARRIGLGLRHFVSVGNKVDVSTNDLLEYWEADDATRVILLYVESFGNPRRFLEIARRVSRKKPIVALKSGRSEAGARAASSHTGALAGRDAVVGALLAQAGVVRVTTLEELFDAARLLATQPVPRGSRVGILTNAGGPAIIAADALVSLGLSVPELESSTQEELRASLVAEASVSNPVDMVAGATASHYESALPSLLADPNVDAGLAIVVPTKSVSADEIATSLARARLTDKPIAACVLGEYAERARDALEDARVPVYAFPENAAAAFFAVATRYAQYCARPTDAPPVEHPRSRRVAIAGERWLDPREVETILDQFGVHMAASRVVTSPEDAARAATDLGFPVALKIVSRTITHKSDVGGVILALPDAPAVEHAYANLESHITELGRRSELDGVLVQKMAPAGLELFVGMTRDPQFGPLIAFGIGGTQVELLGDVVLRIAPLGIADADEMLDAIRARKLLDGYRGAPAVDRAAVRAALLAVSHLAMDAPEIVEVDVNPLVALGPGRGVVAVDARIRIGRS
jgi:acetyl coenzyme A synthetase (ADP forming)-like protein